MPILERNLIRHVLAGLCFRDPLGPEELTVPHIKAVPSILVQQFLDEASHCEVLMNFSQDVHPSRSHSTIPPLHPSLSTHEFSAKMSIHHEVIQPSPLGIHSLSKAEADITEMPRAQESATHAQPKILAQRYGDQINKTNQCTKLLKPKELLMTAERTAKDRVKPVSQCWSSQRVFRHVYITRSCLVQPPSIRMKCQLCGLLQCWVPPCNGISVVQMCLCLSKSLPSFVPPDIEFSVVISHHGDLCAKCFENFTTCSIYSFSRLVRYFLVRKFVCRGPGISFVLYTLHFFSSQRSKNENICSSSFGVFAKSQKLSANARIGSHNP